MEMDALLNMVFAAVISGLGWWIKSQHDEIKRVTILLNRTREEMAKEYVTKTDNTVVLDRVMVRFDRLEEKIDRLMERFVK
jgi:Tfp pilus assembly protein PilO